MQNVQTPLLKRQSLVLFLLACFALMLSQCSSSKPKCIEDTWSYAKNIHTKINLNPDLQITLLLYRPEVLIRDEAGKDQDASLTTRIIIHGDGRVIRENTFHLLDQAKQDEKQEKEKQISQDQLQQIVALFEEANFFAISVGCQGNVPSLQGGTMGEISVSSEGDVHEIIDHGACNIYSYDQYCDLWDQVTRIIGKFE